MNELPVLERLVSSAVRPNAVLEPTTRQFIDGRNARREPPIYALELKEARRGFVLSQLEEGILRPVDMEDHTIPHGPQGNVKIRIIRPQNARNALPIVMYFHGGGWVIGDCDTHDRLSREIANDAHAAVVFVEYSRSPEVHYPVALEEAYHATSWVVKNGPTLNLDPSRVAVAGDSSGGNLAAALVLLAKARRGPAILFQALFFPTLEASFDTASYHEFATGYFVTREEMQWFWEQYVPEPALRSLPTVVPLRATTAQLDGLPPTLIITSEYDVLRDEGEAYAHKLMQAGVPVTATRYLGTVHAFVVLNALSQTPPARAAISQTVTLLRQMFDQLS